MHALISALLLTFMVLGSAAASADPVQVCGRNVNGRPDMPYPDCELRQADPAHGSFLVRQGIPEIQVLNHDRQVVQRIVEPPHGALTAPWLQDLIGEGHEQLVVPVSEGATGNLVIAIWRERGDGFVRWGEIGGRPIGRTSDGYLVTYWKWSCCDRTASFWRLDTATPRRYAAVELVPSRDQPGSDTCSLIPEVTDLPALNMDLASARARFCGEPVLRH